VLMLLTFRRYILPQSSGQKLLRTLYWKRNEPPKHRQYRTKPHVQTTPNKISTTCSFTCVSSADYPAKLRIRNWSVVVQLNNTFDENMSVFVEFVWFETLLLQVLWVRVNVTWILPVYFADLDGNLHTDVSLSCTSTFVCTLRSV
jgi:hypothetical protein